MRARGANRGALQSEHSVGTNRIPLPGRAGLREIDLIIYSVR